MNEAPKRTQVHPRRPQTGLIVAQAVGVCLTIAFIRWASVSLDDLAYQLLLGLCLSFVLVGALISYAYRRRPLRTAPAAAHDGPPNPLDAARAQERQAAVVDDAAPSPAQAPEAGGNADEAPAPPSAPNAVPVTSALDAGTPVSAPAASAAPQARTSRLAFGELARDLTQTLDVSFALKAFVTDVREREARGGSPREDHAADLRLDSMLSHGADAAGSEERARGTHAAGSRGDELPPCDAELWLAQQLEEAGIFADDVRLPLVQAVRPQRSNMVYLRIIEPTYSWLAGKRLVEIEAALNRVRFANGWFDDLSEATLSELYQFSQRLESSVCAQWRSIAATGLDEARTSADAAGEWAYRQALSSCIESVQLPYRLSCGFRDNLAQGAVAIEIDLTPAEAFPKTYWSRELGRAIPTTTHMRAKAASAYGARVGILLAALAFACSDRVRSVSVAGVSDTSSYHSCLYSVTFDRLRFDTLDLSDLPDPLAVLGLFGAELRARDGSLQPVEQTFGMEEERFCPKRRYCEPGASPVKLLDAQKEALGCKDVAELEINEDLWRRRTADAFVRQLSGNAHNDVSVIMQAARDNQGSGVDEAAARTARAIIDGDLDGSDAAAVEDLFLNGDDLSRAVEEAVHALNHKEPAGAERILKAALAPYEEAHAFVDEPGVSWRYFNSFVERGLYNRLFAEEGARVRLVPDAYFNAHLLLSAACFETGNMGGALAHAQRAHELDPLDDRSLLRIVRCQEQAGDYQGAIDTLNVALSRAHTHESIGVAYYRMAFMQYHLEKHDLARSCYHRCLCHPNSCAPMAVMELASIYNEDRADLHMEDLDRELEAGHIVVAPSPSIVRMLGEGARAATDAEVFLVARNFAQAFAALKGDDVIMNVVRSIEREPDR